MHENILKRIADNDPTAVQDCLKKYGGLVWSLARRMLHNPDDAEDAVQEIFIDVWKNAARFDESQSSETTFIAMISRRRLIDRIRRSKRRVQPTSIEDLTVEPSHGTHQEIQNGLEAREAAKVIDTLRPEQKQVLTLSIYRGMSHQEISEATGMPLGTVKTHARRGLIQIRELLRKGLPNSFKEVSAHD